MSDIAIEHGGTIDKFIGDAILVFFAPASRPGGHRRVASHGKGSGAAFAG